MRVKSRYRTKANTQKVCKPQKPEVFILRTKAKGVRIIGESAAARWLGMKQQEFDRIVRKLLFPPPRNTAYQAKVDRVVAAYPELFKESK